MNEQGTPPGLWPIQGDGVLARQGDLVVLIHPAGGTFADQLLDLLADSARAGEDGRCFAERVFAAFDSDAAAAGKAASGEPGPAAVAFGPDDGGTAVAVYGTAWAEVTTAQGIQLLTAGQPYGRLRCVLPSQATKVRAGVRPGEGNAGTDRYLRLADGIVRAVALVYAPEIAVGAEAVREGAQAVAASAAVAEQPDRAVVADEPEPGGQAVAESAVVADEPGRDQEVIADSAIVADEPGRGDEAVAESAIVADEADEPEQPEQPEQAEQAEQAGEAVAESAIVAEEPGRGEQAASGTGGRPPDHPSRPDFISVSLSGDQAGREVPQRNALPLGSEPPDEQDLGGAERPPPVVIGVHCKNGHFNDPEARYCAVCGIGMAQLTKVPQPGTRPPLGVLVLDDGSVFQLDADYVIGREPSLDSSVADGSARPLRLADASGLVSRIHARVELDGWQVLISDLNSANGTHIRLPGEENSRRLAPGVRAPLTVGAQVRLGGDYGFRYDSHRHR